ncbi:MAG: hypothetical protein PVI90_00100 [Desulfobacteraceae bacterium]|jgi:hypothetical protein
MSNWQQLSTSALEPITDVGTSVSQITNALTTAINIQKTALEILATLNVDTLNTEALIIKTVISTIESILNQYINSDARLHMLVIPPRKRPPYNLQTDFQIPPEETSWNIDPSISEEERKEFNAAITRIATYNQGNEGFLRTIYEETLDDDNDPNKPLYDDAITGTAIVIGASDITSVYNTLNVVQGIIGTSSKGNTTTPHTLTKAPQNLTAKIIAAQNTVYTGVLLHWENQPTTQTLPDFEGLRLRIDEIAIIRSENDNIALAKDWNAIFGNKQPSILTENDTEKTNTLSSADEKTKIILQARYEGIRDSFIDDSNDLIQEKDYYYTIAYRYSLANEPSDTGVVTWEPQNYFRISNVIKVRIRKTTTKTVNSVQPSWTTQTSPLDLIPDLKYFITTLQNNTTTLKSQTTGSATALDSYLTFLETEATRYTDFTTNINAKVSQLSSLVELPTTNIYTTTITLSKGGIYSFLQELTKRMTNETDATAPPFHRKGFVAGIVLIAGSSNEADFALTKTLLELLFGGSTTKTAFEDALDSIDRLLDVAETKIFGDDMQPGTAATAPTTPYKTFDDAMNPVTPDDPTSSIPFSD